MLVQYTFKLTEYFIVAYIKQNTENKYNGYVTLPQAYTVPKIWNLYSFVVLSVLELITAMNK
jgi:hypothetical protein